MTTLRLIDCIGLPVLDGNGARIGRLSDLVGEHVAGPREARATLAAIGVVALAVGTLAVLALIG